MLVIIQKININLPDVKKNEKYDKFNFLVIYVISTKMLIEKYYKIFKTSKNRTRKKRSIK